MATLHTWRPTAQTEKGPGQSTSDVHANVSRSRFWSKVGSHARESAALHFDKVSTGSTRRLSTSDKLRTGPSTSSGQAWEPPLRFGGQDPGRLRLLGLGWFGCAHHRSGACLEPAACTEPVEVKGAKPSRVSSHGHSLVVVQRAAAGLVYPANLVSGQAQPEGLTWLGFEIGVGIHLDEFRPQLHGYQVVGTQGFDDQHLGL